MHVTAWARVLQSLPNITKFTKFTNFNNFFGVVSLLKTGFLVSHTSASNLSAASNTLYPRAMTAADLPWCIFNTYLSHIVYLKRTTFSF